MDRRSRCANFPILAGPQNIPRIRKQPNHLNCAGVLVYLAVREAELSFVRIDGPVGEDQIEFQQLHRRIQSPELEIFLSLTAKLTLIGSTVETVVMAFVVGLTRLPI